jgi:hypothetical protein
MDNTSRFSRFIEENNDDIPDMYIHFMMRDILNYQNEQEIIELSFLEYACAANYCRTTYRLRMAKELEQKKKKSKNFVQFPHQDPNFGKDPKFFSNIYIKGKKI